MEQISIMHGKTRKSSVIFEILSAVFLTTKLILGYDGVSLGECFRSSESNAIFR
jgi:hypothetical protein